MFHAAARYGVFPSRPTCSITSSTVTARVRAASTTGPLAAPVCPSASRTSTDSGAPMVILTVNSRDRGADANSSAKVRAAASDRVALRTLKTRSPAPAGSSNERTTFTPAGAVRCGRPSTRISPAV